MEWVYSFQATFAIFIVFFALFYLLYLRRAVMVSRALSGRKTALFYKAALRTLYFSLFIVALLGPSFGVEKKKVVAVGKDIFFCLDLSESMNATDIAPTRLERVKFEMKKIVNAFQGDRAGIVIFSGDAFVQCPLTYDIAALHLFTQSISTSLVPSTGTAFLPPLRMALKKLTTSSQQGGKEVARIVVLISDGEDFGESTAQLLDEMYDAGIHLYTLGVGTTKGGKVPASRGGYKYNKQSGEVIVSRLKGDTLKEAAAQAGGKYFEINEEKNEVPNLIESIAQIQGSIQKTDTIDVGANKAAYFLIMALALLLLDYLTYVRVFHA